MSDYLDDIVGPGAPAIAAATPESDARRIRHLIRTAGFPVIERGGRLYSRRSWIDRYYSGETLVVNGQSAPPTCHNYPVRRGGVLDKAAEPERVLDPPKRGRPKGSKNRKVAAKRALVAAE